MLPGQKTYESTKDDNGSSITRWYDVPDVYDWSKTWQQYNEQGQLFFQQWIQDDTGTIKETDYQPETAKEKEYREYDKDTHLTRAIVYDLGGELWTSIDRSYNAARQVLVQFEILDTGEQKLFEFHYAGEEGWSQRYLKYDTNKQLIFQQVIWTSGAINEYDYLPSANPAGMELQIRYYDANKQLTSSTTFDRRNTAGWEHVDRLYNAARQLTEQHEYYDDGTRKDFLYDPANSVSWSKKIESYNQAGQRTFEQIVHDNGDTTELTFDVTDGSVSLTRWFDAAGKLIGKQTGYEAEYHAAYLALIHFDKKFYLASNPDVKANWNGSAISHFIKYGWKEGRLPYAGFDMPAIRHFANLNEVHNAIEAQNRSDHTKPILIDLSGDGQIDLTPLDPRALADGTGPRFDWDGDGEPDATAWVGPNDGLLVIDLNADGGAGPDGKIDQKREIAFSLWKTDVEIEAENNAPVSDLDGLRASLTATTTNILDINDKSWFDLRFWQDKNQNGISDPGELLTLTGAGIKSINLLASLGDASLRFQPPTPDLRVA